MIAAGSPDVRREVLRRTVGDAYRGTFAAGHETLDVVPPGWEGLHFPFDVPLARLRPDGSPEVDGVPAGFDLPRRMYAGEETAFRLPLRYGETVERSSVVGRVERKQGRSGPLVFADVEHSYLAAGEVAVRSVWRDVFLPAATTAPGSAEPGSAEKTAEPERTDWEWAEPCRLDARQLFRFSALTFNTHRVHYDRTWAREVEGLPDLLVHGPLIRLLLLDLARRHVPDRQVTRAAVRMQGPVYVDTDVQLVGHPTSDGVEVAVLGPEGDRRATARLDLTAKENR